MGIANSKRPQHIGDKLYANYQEYILNHLYVLKELSDVCPVLDNFNEPKDINYFLKTSNPLLNSTQSVLSCLSRKALKENSEESEENLFYGDRNLQQIFTPIKALSKSSYSIATVVGYKGSDPYAVLKFGGLREEVFEDEGILHEIVVGLILNKLRTRTPGFMYTYGGFYCAPPVKIHEYYQLLKDNHKHILEINRKYRIPEEITQDIQKREIDFEYDDGDNRIGDELNSYEEPMDDPDYFINYFMYNYYNSSLAAKFLGETHKQTFEEFKQKVLSIYEILLKSKYFRFKEPNNKKQLDYYKSLVKEKIEIINSITPEEIIKDKKINITKIEPPFSPEHFCNSKEDKTTLVLLEFINNSISQGTFLERDDIDEKDFVKVRLQIILTLFIAFREYRFLPLDLHEENILIRIFDKPQELTYYVQLFNAEKGAYETIEYKMKCRYVAQIIDFGDTYIEYNKIALPDLHNSKKIQINITDIRFLGAVLGNYNEINNTNSFKKIISKLTEEYDEYNTLTKEEKLTSSFANFKLDNFIRSLINIV